MEKAAELHSTIYDFPKPEPPELTAVEDDLAPDDITPATSPEETKQDQIPETKAESVVLPRVIPMRTIATQGISRSFGRFERGWGGGGRRRRTSRSCANCAPNSSETQLSASSAGCEGCASHPSGDNHTKHRR